MKKNLLLAFLHPSLYSLHLTLGRPEKSFYCSRSPDFVFVSFVQQVFLWCDLASARFRRRRALYLFSKGIMEFAFTFKEKQVLKCKASWSKWKKLEIENITTKQLNKNSFCCNACLIKIRSNTLLCLLRFVMRQTLVKVFGQKFPRNSKICYCFSKCNFCIFWSLKLYDFDSGLEAGSRSAIISNIL